MDAVRQPARCRRERRPHRPARTVNSLICRLSAAVLCAVVAASCATSGHRHSAQPEARTRGAHRIESFKKAVAIGPGADAAVRITGGEVVRHGRAITILLNIQNSSDDDVFVCVGPHPLLQPTRIVGTDVSGHTTSATCRPYVLYGPGNEEFAFLKATRRGREGLISDESIYLCSCTIELPVVSGHKRTDLDVAGSVHLLRIAGGVIPMIRNVEARIVIEGDEDHLKVSEVRPLEAGDRDGLLPECVGPQQ